MAMVILKLNFNQCMGVSLNAYETRTSDSCTKEKVHYFDLEIKNMVSSQSLQKKFQKHVQGMIKLKNYLND
jgi:hypothetical protein